MWCVCELSPKERKIYFRENWLKSLAIRGAAEFWGFGEHKQNTFRELRPKKIRDLGRSEHYFQGAREQGPPSGAQMIIYSNFFSYISFSLQNI